jgi:hypothetical protein
MGELGVYLPPDEKKESREIHPGQQHNHRTNAAIGGIIGGKIGELSGAVDPM